MELLWERMEKYGIGSPSHSPVFSDPFCGGQGEMGYNEAWATINSPYTRTKTWARLDLKNLNLAVSPW